MQDQDPNTFRDTNNPSNSATEFEPYTITTDITRYSPEIPYSPYWTDESDTASKEEDEEDIDYLYRVGVRWLYQNDRSRKNSRSSTEKQIQRGLSHLRDKEYVDELFSGTTNGEGSTSNRDNDL